MLIAKNNLFLNILWLYSIKAGKVRNYEYQIWIWQILFYIIIVFY